MFGRKIMRYKQWEMDHISTFIQAHANGGAILDMGCSTGHMVEILSNHFGANRIHGDSVIFENILNVCRDKFANVHVRNYKYGPLQKDVNAADLEIISHRSFHCYRANSNKKQMGNYSLILYTEKAPLLNGA